VLASAGPAVAAREHTSPGTGLHSALAVLLALFGIIVLAASTFGFGLLALLIAPIADWLLRRRIMATLRASCLEIGPNQLPEIHACVRTYAQRLGMKEAPDVFIVESNTMNAAALRVGARKVVHLIDDVVWGAIKAGDTGALSFVIAHELAHHALGHTGGFRSYIRNVYRKLSRLDELSADAVAMQLVGSRETAYSGLMMLMVGPQLLPYINREQLLRQAAEADADKATKKAERIHTHPFLTQRLQYLRGAALGARSR
jgi:Zn-dependent protease with chaperone function